MVSNPSGNSARTRVLVLKLVAWAALSGPLLFGLYRWFLGDGFGFDPVEEMLHFSGLTAVIVLLSAVAVTPLRRWTGVNDLQKLRRLIGLWAFVYALIHFTIYLTLDQWFDLALVWEDIAERPFILSGFTALVLMVPLALTSTKGWIRRLGKRWVTLHRLVYLSAGLAVLHFWWGQKADTRNPLIAAALLAVLLGARAWWAFQKKNKKSRAR